MLHYPYVLAVHIQCMQCKIQECKPKEIIIKSANALQIVLVRRNGDELLFFYSQTMSSFWFHVEFIKQLRFYSLCNAILETEFQSIYLTWTDCP